MLKGSSYLDLEAKLPLPLRWCLAAVARTFCTVADVEHRFHLLEPSFQLNSSLSSFEVAGLAVQEFLVCTTTSGVHSSSGTSSWGVPFPLFQFASRVAIASATR
ncbi:hypothetical protein Tco_0286025 [Tanacetum coccineum]